MGLNREELIKIIDRHTARVEEYIAAWKGVEKQLNLLDGDLEKESTDREAADENLQERIRDLESDTERKVEEVADDLDAVVNRVQDVERFIHKNTVWNRLRWLLLGKVD